MSISQVPQNSTNSSATVAAASGALSIAPAWMGAPSASGAAVSGLGITCEIDNPPPYQERRRERFLLQDYAMELLPGERIRHCLVDRVAGSYGVTVESDGEHANYGDLQTCGSVWSCPICSQKINIARREELTEAMDIARRMGFGVYLVTFTLQHDHDDRLVDLVRALKDAYSRLKRGAPWGRIVERFGIVGHITATEGTHGAHGWHPHLHALFFTSRPLIGGDRDALRGVLSARFVVMVGKVGKYASEYHAVDLRDGKEAGDYVTKWGLENELTNHDAKQGHGDTPFQLLGKYSKGDKWAGNLFKEWALTMKGKRQLVWSNGLRDLFELETEKSDVELAEEQKSEVKPVMVLYFEQWLAVRRGRLRAVLLDVFESQGLDAAWALLASLGVPRTELNDRLLVGAIFAPVAAAMVKSLEEGRERLELEELEKSVLIREGVQALARGEYQDDR